MTTVMSLFQKHRFAARLITTLFWLIHLHSPLYANPYFYIQGDQQINGGNHTWYLRINTDGERIGALQTSLSYNTDTFDPVQTSTQNSICNIWSAADSIPPGQDLQRVTPYFYEGRLVLSCGITGTGYNGSDGLVASFTLIPKEDAFFTFSLANSKYIYQGTNILPGAEAIFSGSILNWNLDSNIPTPTPNSATSSALITTRTLFSDVTFQQWNPNTRSTGATTTTGSSESQLETVELDNTVPPPPPGMTPRPAKTPLALADMANVEPATESGEVKAIQSLRDLLIPGKSEADKTVVIVNFITTITFLIILAIILWRMMMNSRANKLKSQYINELITGELSALESKMEIVGEKAGRDRFEAEFEKSVQHILKEVDPSPEKDDKVTNNDNQINKK